MQDEDHHRSFLVIQTASIGDVILATSVLEKLKASYPAAAIDILVRQGSESLFAGHPFLRRVWVWDKRKAKYRRLFALLRQIRRERYTAVIDLHRFASSGILTAFSKAGQRIGFDKNPLSRWFTWRVAHVIGGDHPVHETVRNQALLEQLAPGDPGPVRLYPTPEDEQTAAPYTEQEFITVFPFSLWFTKQWPAEKWAELIAASAKYRVLLMGSSAEREKMETHFGGLPGTVNLAGKFSLLQTAAVMKKARMNFTNDSAPLHLASAVDAPLTAVFCSTVPDFGFGPLGDQAVVVQTDEKLACRPCGIHGLRACPEKHLRCGYGIDVKKLINRIEHA